LRAVAQRGDLGKAGGGAGFEIAEDALGLERLEGLKGRVGRALVLGVVSMEADEGGSGRVVGEGVGGCSLNLGLKDTNTAHIPGGAKEIGEGIFFEGALGLEVEAKGGFELGENRLVFGADYEGSGSEVVFGGVLSRTGFAGDGAGAGGKLGIAAI
jgi:hypothetical protein